VAPSLYDEASALAVPKFLLLELTVTSYFVPLPLSGGLQAVKAMAPNANAAVIRNAIFFIFVSWFLFCRDGC
jgi:hypothetical protein